LFNNVTYLSEHASLKDMDSTVRSYIDGTAAVAGTKEKNIQSEGTGWRFVSFVDYNELVVQLHSLRNLILIITLIIIVVVLAASYLFSRQFSKPIQLISRNRKRWRKWHPCHRRWNLFQRNWKLSFYNSKRRPTQQLAKINDQAVQAQKKTCLFQNRRDRFFYSYLP
jgi:hypothetical protein